jgi:hypothetical protein
MKRLERLGHWLTLQPAPPEQSVSDGEGHAKALFGTCWLTTPTCGSGRLLAIEAALSIFLAAMEHYHCDEVGEDSGESGPD